MQGIAAGAGVPFAAIFILNCLDEIETIMPPSLTHPRAGHCSDVLVGAPMGLAVTTPRLIAHNEDAAVTNYGLMALLEGAVPLVQSGVTFTFVGYIYAGELASGAFAFNDAGVFFSTNGTPCSPLPRYTVLIIHPRYSLFIHRPCSMLTTPRDVPAFA